MDDILSQIIAYAPDRIDTELKVRALVQGSRNMDQEPRNMYNQGQLVQNTIDGSRPGYSGNPLKEYKMTSGGRRLGVTVEGGERVSSKIMRYIYKDKATGKEIDVYKVKITDKPSQIDGTMKAGTGGDYKTLLSGPDKTEFSTLKEAETARDNYYKENPLKKPKGNESENKKKARKIRKNRLNITDPTRAEGVEKNPFHHIRQIGGDVPLTTDDIAIIKQRMNSVMSQYNEPLNRIADAISKNNKLSLEAMNAKNENAALKYMKRVGELNDEAESLVKSAIKKLPNEYKNLIGFNRFSLPTDEYGLPIENEPLVVKKVGGAKVTSDAIPLTDLTLKQEKALRTQIKADAKAGKDINQNQLKKDLLKLAGTANKKCKGLLSYGGRVGLAEGLSPEFCINEGKKVARDLVAKNIEGTLAQKSIMKRVTSGVTNFVKSILDPKELFDIKKQLFSKGAIASVPIFDAVMAADDALRKDMDPKEAFAKTLSFGSIPRAMGFTDNIGVINAKKMLENPNLSPAGKEYAQLIIDSGDYEKMQSDTTGGMTKKFTEFKEMQNKIKNASTSGRFDYENALAEMQGTFKAKPKENKFFFDDAPDKPDVTPLTNKFATPAKSRGPMTEKKKQKVDYTPLTYQNYKPFSFTKEEFEDTMRQMGSLKEGQIYNNDFYKETIEAPMKASQFKEFMEVPGFKGTQNNFSEGGIASLNVNKKK
jgi:hypothetical protein